MDPAGAWRPVFRSRPLGFFMLLYSLCSLVGCVAQWLERRSLTCELSLTSARSAADV